MKVYGKSLAMIYKWELRVSQLGLTKTTHEYIIYRLLATACGWDVWKNFLPIQFVHPKLFLTRAVQLLRAVTIRPAHARPPHSTCFFFCARARCLSAGLRYLRLTRLPRHDRGPVPGGNRSAASCLCTVLRRALYHYATRSPTATLYMGYSSTANHQMLPSPRKEFGPQWCPSN